MGSINDGFTGVEKPLSTPGHDYGVYSTEFFNESGRVGEVRFSNGDSLGQGCITRGWPGESGDLGLRLRNPSGSSTMALPRSHPA
jgi:hypothetical protein